MADKPQGVANVVSPQRCPHSMLVPMHGLLELSVPFHVNRGNAFCQKRFPPGSNLIFSTSGMGRIRSKSQVVHEVVSGNYPQPICPNYGPSQLVIPRRRIRTFLYLASLLLWETHRHAIGLSTCGLANEWVHCIRPPTSSQDPRAHEPDFWDRCECTRLRV